MADELTVARLDDEASGGPGVRISLSSGQSVALSRGDALVLMEHLAHCLLVKVVLGR